jgi:RimJ/RimL family protein N-acetyltransferase
MSSDPHGLAGDHAAEQPFRVEIPGIDTVLVRPLRLDADMIDLQDWFQRDYARFWNMQDKSLAAVHESYRALVSRQNFEVLIGYLESSGAKAFLLEVYRPDQDQLRHYYLAEATDRGCHFFIAPAARPVSGFSYYMLGAMADYVFADPAVQRIVAEPDIRNRKIIARLIQRGFRLGRVVQLPHKTAQLVFLSRERHARRRSLPPGRKPQLSWYAIRARCHVFAGRVIRRLRRLWLPALSGRH